MRALVLILALLHGCVAKAPPPEGPVPQDFTLQQRACDKAGGRWGQGGKGGFFVCYRTTRDGGKACAAAGDCQGLCLSRSRSCAPVTPLFGCQDILNGDGQPSRVCVD